jgi:site-specific recombinase XerD
MAVALRKVARLLGHTDINDVNWVTLNAASVDALVSNIRGDDGQTLAPASVALVLSALRGVARAAWRRGTLDTETYERIRDVKGKGGSRGIAGRDVDVGERASLIQACAADNSPAGYRDTALIAMLIATGMRRAEVASLTLADVVLGDDSGRITFIGKGDKQRTAYIRNGAYKALRDWLAVRGGTADGDAPGALFCAINKAGVMLSEHGMSTTAVHLILQKRAAEAGLAPLSAHDLRRTFVGEMLDAGQDIATVAAIVGHSSVVTTARYDRRGERAKEVAAGFINVPYTGRRMSHA